jgi:hypothetical protein
MKQVVDNLNGHRAGWDVISATMISSAISSD